MENPSEFQTHYFSLEDFNDPGEDSKEKLDAKKISIFFASYIGTVSAAGAKPNT